MHKVLAHSASRGHYAAWVCEKYPFLSGRSSCPAMETVDNIQLARLGGRWLYRMMAELLLTRLGKAGKLDKQYDLIVDCVSSYPFPIHHYTTLPVLPMVFDLARNADVSAYGQGPLVVANHNARERLLAKGIDERRIVRAPFAREGELPPIPAARPPEPSILLCDDRPRRILRELKKLRGNVTIELFSRRPHLDIPNVNWHPHDDMKGLAEACDKCWFAWCGPGLENKALYCAGYGLPAVAFSSEAARDAISVDESGLLLPRQDGYSEVVNAFEWVLSDEVLRKRLSSGARRLATDRTWENTADRFLATIEIL